MRVAQVYEELVFVEPAESFYRRVVSTPLRPAAELSCQPYTVPCDDREDLDRLRECRARVAAMVADVKKNYTE